MKTPFGPFNRQLIIGIVIMLIIFGVTTLYERLSRPAVNLIAIGQEITSTVYALHAEGSLIGVDDTSLSPPSVNRKTMVGHFGSISADTLLKLNPTHVVMLPDGMTHQEIVKLQDAGVAVSVLPLVTEKQILDMIAAIGEITRRESKAISLIEGIEEKYSILLSSLRALDSAPPEVLVLSKIGETSLIAWGQNTPATTLLTALKANNAVKELGQIPWRPDLLQIQPAAIVVLTQKESLTADEDKALAVLLGVPSARVLTLPQAQAFGLGPDFIDVWIRLANFIHPELQIEFEGR